ncbi:MAG: hypothetical protein P9M07_00605 [Candidatus Aceula meridiana]|nr:hypothetical protein [Candidatus Aceula meridiana]
MKKNFAIILAFITISLVSTSCDMNPFSAKQESLRLEDESFYIQDIELAKALVWPKPREISFERDVFRPLVGEGAGSASITGRTGEEGNTQVADLDRFVLTATFLSDNSIAYIKPKDEGKAFFVHVGEKIGSAVVKEIKRNEVIVELEGQEIFLKILGGQK